MRRPLLLLLIAFLVVLSIPATAATLPNVTLGTGANTVTGGLPVTIIISADQPISADTEIRFFDSGGNTYTAVIIAGQTETAVTVPTPVVEKRTFITFTLQNGNGYQGISDVTITLYPLPKIKFYEPIYARFLNRECSIAVEMAKNDLQADGEFELRNQTGDTLATMTVKQNTSRTLFNFTWTPTKNQVGRHDLSVWYHGYRISGEPGYLSLADTHNLAVYGCDISENFIALSLDCAYEWDYIDDFLAMLDRQDVKVTFFMTGFGVQDHPDEVLKLLQHGHELANHSYHHYHMTELDELRVMRREIRSTNNVIQELTGITPTLFRPPYGDYDRFVAAMALGEGCTTIMWTNDAKDWVDGATVRSIYRNIIRNPAPGNIILAHILNHDTVEAMDMAITYFKEQGYRLGTISELLTLVKNETGKDTD